MRTTHCLPVWLIGSTLIAGCSDSGIPKAASKDVKEAVQLVSTSTEYDTAKIQRAFDLVKKHPQGDALNALTTWLDSRSATQRRAAVYTLQMVSWDDARPAFAKLRGLLSHSEALTRGMAAMALASLGDKESYENIKNMLAGDSDAYVRRCAAWALGELDDERALDSLRKAAADADPNVRANAENAVQRLTFRMEHKDVRGDAEHVISGIWLISGSTMQHAERLDRAMRLIRACSEPQRGELLQRLVNSKSEAIRNSAALALQRLKEPKG